MNKPKVILFFGPTGVGKTALLNRIFSHGAELVNADALQVYRHLDIGTAKPGPEILSRIPHHLIDIINYSENFNVGDFCLRADEAVAGIIRRDKLPVISGGTAYYFKSWLLGMPDTPCSDPLIRSRLEKQWNEKSDDELRDGLRQVDPVSSERIGKGDRYRMLRAMEVYNQTGRPLSSFRIPKTPRDDYMVLSIGLMRERKELYQRINQRVDQMFLAGLPAEVASLRDNGAVMDDPGMKAIGYREWFPKVGDPPLDENRVKELIARNTRRYAKRQITFFSSLPDVHWFDAGDDPEGTHGIIPLIKNFLNNNVSSNSIDQDAPVGDNP
ncbi:MAG: tRNA (adenosine(37)-N6)-dimethylallyltransferase MiaA [Spirochaetaceae bacterium]|nr:tRNA (adenosine(37)-N6)-dimethylallyltransferase MiaA [Spirochaetaceae bacterium]